MDDYTALKVAEALGIDPLEVIAIANAERTKRPEVKAAWEQIATRTAHAAMLILLVFSIFPPSGQAETKKAELTQFIYYAKLRALLKSLRRLTRGYHSKASLQPS